MAPVACRNCNLLRDFYLITVNALCSTSAYEDGGLLLVMIAIAHSEEIGNDVVTSATSTSTSRVFLKIKV